MWASICKKLSNKLGTKIEYRSNHSIQGGCINNTQALKTTHGSYFVKLNSREHRAMFEAEAESLKAIKSSNAIRCSEVILADEIEGYAVLILEFIPMQPALEDSMEKLGQQLAMYTSKRMNNLAGMETITSDARRNLIRITQIGFHSLRTGASHSI